MKVTDDFATIEQLAADLCHCADGDWWGETKLTDDAERARWIAFVQAQALPLDVACKKWRKKWRKSRTDPQNNYLFGVCYVAIARTMGYTVDDLHTWVCGTFFGWVDRKVPKTPRNPDGVESVPFRTTTRDANGKRDVIDPQRFGELLETVVFRAAAQCGAFIPEPYAESE